MCCFVLHFLVYYTPYRHQLLVVTPPLNFSVVFPVSISLPYLSRLLWIISTVLMIMISLTSDIVSYHCSVADEESIIHSTPICNTYSVILLLYQLHRIVFKSINSQWETTSINILFLYFTNNPVCLHSIENIVSSLLQTLCKKRPCCHFNALLFINIFFQ